MGLIPKDKNDVVNCISQIFENPSAYANCREVARKYYDLAGIMNRTIMIYDNLFEQYYGGTCNMRNYAESCSIMDRNQIDM